MKTTSAIILSALIIFTSCKNDSTENLNSSSTTKIVETKAAESIENSLVELETSYSSQIVGLWKLNKHESQNGDSYFETNNEFMEIKSNKRYEENSYRGVWFLSFCKDSTGIVALLSKIRRYNQYELKVDVNRISIINENNTRYLKLTTMKDGSSLYYIRQQ